MTEITYASDLIPAKAVLSTMAVFYDKIYLPHPYGWNPKSRVLWSNWGGNFDQEHDYVCRKYEEWCVSNELLFRECIIETLPDLFEQPACVPENISEELLSRFGIAPSQFHFSCEDLIQKRVKLWNSTILNQELALALHFAFSPPKGFDFFWEGDLNSFQRWTQLNRRSRSSSFRSTNEIVGLLVKQLLSYRLPKLNLRSCEEIISARERFKDGRRALHLVFAEQATKVEDRIREGQTDLEAAAAVIEREFIPAFEEFERILSASRSGALNRYVDGFLKIDAAPWTPKFFVQVAAAFFGAAERLSEDNVNAATNKHRAFTFIARLT